MKLIITIFLFTVCFSTQVVSQNSIDRIQITPILDTFEITTSNDTIFNYQLEIVVNDTNAINSLNVIVLTKVESNLSWETKYNKTFTDNLAIAEQCSSPLCAFKKNANVWVVNLGGYSQFVYRKLELYINSSKSDVPSNWSSSF